MGVVSVIQSRRIHQGQSRSFIDRIVNTVALLVGTATLLIAPLATGAESIIPTETATPTIQPLLAQAVPVATKQLANGIYLFGEKPLPDQLQTAYMIFEARADQVVGAFYSPHSSFDCFEGNVQNTQLSLAITETYSQDVYPYQLSLDDTAIAGPGGSEFAIEGFHQIDAVSENDMRMLNTCQEHFGQTI